MTRPEPILKSEKITALLEKRDKLNANAAQCRADVWRLTKLLQRLGLHHEHRPSRNPTACTSKIGIAI
jgi:hypothetical protein